METFPEKSAKVIQWAQKWQAKQIPFSLIPEY